MVDNRETLAAWQRHRTPDSDFPKRPSISLMRWRTRNHLKNLRARTRWCGSSPRPTKPRVARKRQRKARLKHERHARRRGLSGRPFSDRCRGTRRDALGAEARARTRAARRGLRPRDGEARSARVQVRSAGKAKRSATSRSCVQSSLVLPPCHQGAFRAVRSPTFVTYAGRTLGSRWQNYALHDDLGLSRGSNGRWKA